jgi:hypothetical protein
MVASSRAQQTHFPIMPRWSAPESFERLSVFKGFYQSVVLFGVLMIMGGHSADAANVKCIADGMFDTSFDNFEYKAAPEDSALFSVKYEKYYKVVTNILLNTTYVLTMCGAPQLDAKEFPNGSKFFVIPLTHVAVDETTGATMLEALGLRTSISFIDTTYLSSPCLNEMANRSLVQKFESTWGDAAIRQSQILHVDAVIGGVSDKPKDPKYIPFPSTLDPGPIKIAEWIKFLSLFFNAEQVANSVFSQAKDRYICHGKSAAAAAYAEGAPVVAWLDYWSWETMPFRVQNTAYKRQLTQVTLITLE